MALRRELGSHPLVPHSPSSSVEAPAVMSNNLICFGNVVRLTAKSAFVDGDAAGGCIGFLPQKNELLLVVSPVKDDVKDTFLEAEFVVAPLHGDKTPPPGTPINYKQPFVLMTSDGQGYSLNNKTPNMTEVVSLRQSQVKGELYVAVEKEGFGTETHVQNGDTGLTINVVDSNRIRKTYNNKPLKHFVKPKSDAPGGFVTCGNKGHVLSFRIEKLDKAETRSFIKNPIIRRASQILADAKADEVSEASVLESPSRAGSIVTTGALVAEDPTASPPSSPTAAPEPKIEATPESDTPVPTADTTATVTAPEPETLPATPAHETGGVDAAVLTAQLEQVVVEAQATPAEPVVAVEPVVPMETKPSEAPQPSLTPVVVSTETQSALATIELSASSVSDSTAQDGSAPVHDKLATAHASESQLKTTTEISELDTLPALQTVPEEQLDTACVGKCSIM